VSKLLREKLKAIQTVEGHINPRQEWVSRTRESLLYTISQSQTSATSDVEKHNVSKSVGVRSIEYIQALLPKHIFSHMKPAFVSLLVFILATSGWIASASASESLPGDAMWHVKLASEKTQIVLADLSGDAQKNVTLQLKFATRRAEEIKTVSTEESFAPEEKAKRSVEGLKKLKEHIAVVQHATEGESSENKKQLGKQATVVNDATVQISQTLDEVADVVKTASDNASLTKEFVAVQQAVDQVGFDVAKVAVEEATSDEEKSVAQDLVEKKIVSALSDADGALGDTREVKELMSTIADPSQQLDLPSSDVTVLSPTNTTAFISFEQATGTIQEIGETVSGTPFEEDHIGSSVTVPVSILSPTTKQTITSILTQVDNTSEKVRVAVAEIKTLIDVGDLTAALEKAKELRRVTTVSTQTNVDIKEAVKRVTDTQTIQKETDPARTSGQPSVASPSTNVTSSSEHTTVSATVPTPIPTMQAR